MTDERQTEKNLTNREVENEELCWK